VYIVSDTYFVNRPLIQAIYSSTHGGLKSKTYVATKKGKIYLRHNSIHEDVPIVVALKALGIQSDKEILLLTAGNTESYKTAFSGNLEEAAKLGVFTRHQALEYIGTRVKVNRRVIGPRRPAWEEALEALATIVLAHVPVDGLDFRAKAIFVATMTRRVLMAMDDEKWWTIATMWGISGWSCESYSHAHGITNLLTVTERVNC
jgi:DNA-directed RNA polymerase III subunit RPC2